MKPQPKKKLGRPPLARRLVPAHVSLREEHLDYARERGDGELSRGIRDIIAAAMAQAGKPLAR